jgi:hypothetical protein
VRDYRTEITYELELLGGGEEEAPPLDAKWVATAVEKLGNGAAKGDEQAQAVLVRVDHLLDRGRERRRRVDELRRRLGVRNQDAEGFSDTIE